MVDVVYSSYIYIAGAILLAIVACMKCTTFSLNRIVICNHMQQLVQFRNTSAKKDGK